MLDLSPPLAGLFGLYQPGRQFVFAPQIGSFLVAFAKTQNSF
jgi:hypothetical protein